MAADEDGMEKGNLPQFLAKVKMKLLLSVRSALTTEVVSKALVESATPCHDAQWWGSTKYRTMSA